MKSLILIIKGFFIGIAKIIPGVSGALLAITFKLYEPGLEAITNFFSNPKKNSKFLFQVGLGILIGIITFSKVVNYLLNNYYFLTMFFFIGLISAGLVPIIKDNKNKNKKIIIISFLSLFFLTKLKITNIFKATNLVTSLIIYFISGILDAASTVIPGISGTAILMLIGTYKDIIYVLGNITKYQIIVTNLNILLPYTFGMILGIILFVKVMHYLFHKKYEKTISFIIGISLATLFALIIRTFAFLPNLKLLTLALPLSIIGYIIGRKMDC